MIRFKNFFIGVPIAVCPRLGILGTALRKFCDAKPQGLILSFQGNSSFEAVGHDRQTSRLYVVKTIGAEPARLVEGTARCSLPQRGGRTTGVSLIVDLKIAAVHDVKIINAQTMCQCSLIP
jgi:hypothetical protein